MDFDPSQLREDDSRDFERIATIKESAQHLISALQIERDPDIERTILSFDPQDGLSLPPFIFRNLQPDSKIDQIWIDSTVNRLTDKGEFAFYTQAHSTGGDIVVIGVNVLSDPDHSLETALVVADDELPVIEPATSVELNRFLASLFTRSKTGDYSAFDEMDLKDPVTLERLTEIISASASESIKHNEYVLSDILSHTMDAITYVERDGMPIECDVTIEHRGKASTFEITLSQDGYEDTRTHDDPEFIMQALDGIRTYIQDIDGERKQVPSTNDGLQVLDGFLEEKSALVFAKSPEEEFLPEHDVDPSLTINYEACIKETSDDDLED